MFYKLLDDNSLTSGPFVQSLDYILDYHFKDDYTFPIDGWYWFDTDEEANEFFNIEPL